MIVYGDYECPFCAAAEVQLREREVQVAFRHFPIRSSHPRAHAAAHAAEAAAEQGAFWAMHDALYAQRGRLELEDVLRAASEAGVDPERVRTDLEAGVYAPRVARDAESALAGGVTGTPGFFANGVRVEGSFDAQSLLAALEAPR